MVDFGCILPNNPVDQTDRKNRMGLCEVVAFLQLTGIKLATIKNDPLNEALRNRELHFDVVDGSRLIDGLDVENR